MMNTSSCYNKPVLEMRKSLKQKLSPTARAVYQHELDGDGSTDGEDGDYLEEVLVSDGIDTPSEDFYNINTTNFNRNLTEKLKGSQQGHKMQHNGGKDSLLGSLLVLPVELWKGIAG